MPRFVWYPAYHSSFWNNRLTQLSLYCGGQRNPGFKHCENCPSTTITAAKLETRVPAINSHPRTITQSQFETLWHAHLWKEKLTAMGWHQRPASQLSLHWATSTLSLYNRQVNDFYSFCSSNGLPFPPDDSSIIACATCAKWPTSPQDLNLCSRLQYRPSSIYTKPWISPSP